MLASELGHLKKVGGVSVDGTKIKANASKNSAVSYKQAGKIPNLHLIILLIKHSLILQIQKAE